VILFFNRISINSYPLIKQSSMANLVYFGNLKLTC